MKRTIIVVVEDDPLSRLVAVDAFERAGFDVADFSSADDAASYAERMAPSIAALVADIRMPGERDGIDLACAFRDRWPEIAVLVTSGRFGPHGPFDMLPTLTFLPKPWTSKTLLAGLNESLAHADGAPAAS